MEKIVETKKRRKKGRPSLLDLQKRKLQQQQQQQQQQLQQQRINRNSNPNPNPNPSPSPSPNPNRRFTRRNPTSDGSDSEGDGREKKLKFVLRLPQQNQDSQFLNWDLYGSDSNADDDGGGAPKKKRKINAAARHGKGEERQDSTSKTTVTNLGTSIDDGPTSTPLPDKMLLVFILDRVQKKDTYGVFSEPVDPEELPDYHEIVKDPMDFSTVRKKLDDGAYSCLEEFEKDVFLICSNAMQYNAPDTIYFRQARTMQELAKKNFENLRQDSDYESEPEPKVARRGRPPTKNLKKQLGKPLSERAGSELFSDAALVTGGEHAGGSNTYNLRKGPLSDRFGSNDASGRTSRCSEASGSSLAEHKFERNDDYTGSTSKGFSWKFGKRQFVIDENRRNTYQLSHQSTSGQDPSVFTTFYAENKQLMAVGVHTELGYARSLARFAASLGPVAWKIASKKIERALPSGVKFGPGWVGENDSPDCQPSSSMANPSHMVPPQSLSLA
ncbi:hypothetical protein Sjap_009714 [Stephania japonica]|uniref:Bromo domain-containing protein n=1 Tax=Stephania japonica TaxID=461633 RepID=A0AAP0JAD4_9MAGN